MTSLIVLQGCRTIQLTQGYNTLVDEADYPFLAEVKWHTQKWKPEKCKSIYAQGAIRLPDGKWRCVRMHRFLAGLGPQVDHRNGDGLDNRRENLRPCTKLQNQRNSRPRGGKSKFKGVSARGSKWQAAIGEGPGKYLGSFPTEAEAARAYDAAARELFGEFAATNADIFGEVV